MDDMIQTQESLSVAIIMDGNRRWAKEKGLASFLGHRAGYDTLRNVLMWSKDAGVKYLTVYAFSTENWNRSEEEINYLFGLFQQMISDVVADAKASNMRIFFAGERSRFPTHIISAIEHAEKETGACTAFTLCIALSYGGRTEIIDAIHRIPKETISEITEEAFAKLLWTKDIPDPDIIIRTSGEERLSNFLPWQSVYSELFFTKTLWPDFSQQELLNILMEYKTRDRRIGA